MHNRPAWLHWRRNWAEIRLSVGYRPAAGNSSLTRFIEERLQAAGQRAEECRRPAVAYRDRDYRFDPPAATGTMIIALLWLSGKSAGTPAVQRVRRC